MLHEFVTTHRDELIARCRKKTVGRFVSSRIYEAVDHGVPLFLRQLVETLRREQRTAVRDDVEPGTSAPTEIGRAAALHGSDLLRLGFSVDQVVYGYGDVCQSITDLAIAQKADISADEFRTLNRCLDNAIAHAVTAFGHAHQVLLSEQAETLQQLLTHFSEGRYHRKCAGQKRGYRDVPVQKGKDWLFVCNLEAVRLRCAVSIKCSMPYILAAG